MRPATTSVAEDRSTKNPASPNFLLGIGSAVAVIFIWSGFFVFSRAGVTTSLTAFDITALRFGVASLLVLPFAHAWWPRHLSIKAQAIMAICGPGAVYSVLLYRGLSEASAAYGGVFANGSLPIFTLLLLVLLSGERPGRRQILAIAIIIAGGVLLGFPHMMSGGADVIAGIAFFLTASAILSAYIVGVRRWAVTPKQALALVTLPNALVFLPLWYVFLPSGLAETELSTILFQAAFQGLGPGFLAIILFALAAFHLGPAATAGFSAAVPATAALLAVPVLSEMPGPLEWTGIVTVTLGLSLLVARR